MADLVSGRYPQQNPLWSVFGQQNNESQSDVPAFYNQAPLPGVNGLVESAAGVITKEEVIFPVYVPYGVSLKTLKWVQTATELASITHAWWTVRSAPSIAIGGEFKPQVQAQSKDTTTLATTYAGKTETVTLPELEKSVLVTPENAPNGYVYVSIFIEGTVGTQVSFKTPATATYKAVSGLKVYPWFANAPIWAKSKPTSKTEAENTLTSLTQIETVPLVQVS